MSKKNNPETTGDTGEPELSRRERKRQKKALLLQQIEYEKQLVDEGKIPPRARYKTNNFFWRVFALCIAFFFGIFAAIGGIAAFGVAAPIGTVTQTFGLDISKILKEEYASKSIVDLIQTISGDEFNSLNSIGKYTPVLDEYLADFEKSFSDLGAHIDMEALKAVPFDQIGTYVQDNVIDGIVLGDTIGLNAESESLLLSIFFGEEGVDYTVQDGKIVMNEGKSALTVGKITEAGAMQEILDKIVLGDTLGLTAESDGLLLGIFYGEEGVDYTIQDGKIVMNEGKTALTVGDVTEPGAMQSIINKITIEQALGIDADANAALLYLAYGTEGVNYKIEDGQIVMLENPYTGEPFAKKTLADLTDPNADPIGDARIGDIIAVEEGDAGILSAIKDWKISDLQDSYRIERLKIRQVMDIDSNSSRTAQAIKDWRIGDFISDSKMGTLMLGDIIAIDGSSPRILRSLENTRINRLGDAVESIRLSDILEDEDFEDNNFLNSLRMSSLPTLSDDLKHLSAADVFGAEMYSYLAPSENDGLHYEDLYRAYEKGHENADSSNKVPKAYELGETDTVHNYYTAEGTSAKIIGGYYYTEDGTHHTVPVSDVYSRKVEKEHNENTIEYYVKREQELTPHYVWNFVDYANKQLSAIPAGDSISTETAGYEVVRTDGTPFTDEKGAPYYYLTTRAIFENGAPSGRTEKVAYPIVEDDSGLHYSYVAYEGKDVDGAMQYNFRQARVDLEHFVESYTYEENGAPVTLTQRSNGDWVRTDGREEKVVYVYVHPVTDGVPESHYVEIQKTVHYGYYEESLAEGGVADRIYSADDLTQKFEIVKADGAAVEVDRYLSGVWYFLFGGENEDGKFADNSDMAVLDLTGEMNGMMKHLSETPLWQLYFHNLLTANPFVDLTHNPLSLNDEGIAIGSKKIKNLNECTIIECISLVETLVEKLSSIHI